MLWVKTAKHALENGHQVLVSMFGFDKLPEPILELKKLGAEFHFRRKVYPDFSTRLKKKVRNKLASANKKTTYHDYLLKFKADRIFFSLAGGDEIARDEGDLMLFIKQHDIKYYIFCHSISTVPDTNERLNRNMKLSFEKAENVFFTSRMQVDMLEHQLMSSMSNAKVMAHPVNITTPENIVQPDGKTVNFAIVGSFTLRHKGQDVALKVLSGEQWKGRDFKLNIYGNGAEGAYLKDMVVYYGLEDKVAFHAFEADPVNIWKSNAMLLIPTRQDSGPITMFEAMCCGRPVVGTRMGAIPDYVTDNVNGIVCEPFSYKSFEMALETAWNNKERWEEWGQASLRTIKERYDFNPERTLLNTIIS